MNTKRIVRQIEARKKAVGVERDRLRALVSDLGELEETCSRAYEDLENAVQALSELV